MMRMTAGLGDDNTYIDVPTYGSVGGDTSGGFSIPDPAGILAFAYGLRPTGSVVFNASGQPVGTAATPVAKNNTLLYVGIGVIAVVLLMSMNKR